jgi:proteasome activator subunit 4
MSSQMTATHQLKIALMSVAFVGRSLFLTSRSAPVDPVDIDGGDMFTDLLMVSLSNALLGMDANDPPKTLATMQLIGSIFSNVSTQDPNVLIECLIHMPIVWQPCKWAASC